MHIRGRYVLAGIAGWIFCCLQAVAQQLQPGFNPKEYEQLLRISAYQVDTPWASIMIPGYTMPGFVNSHSYTPAGTPVILAPLISY